MSGSGQTLQDVMSNPDFQKYLVDFGTGMAGRQNLAESLAGGIQNAGTGLSKRMEIDAETARRKKMINDVLGGDISKLTGSELARKGMELLNTGDPNLGAIGQKMIDTSMRKSAEWQQTTVDVGGRQIPAQVNTQTGEIKPYSADVINGPKLTYVPELQTFVDQYGNAGTPSNAPQAQSPMAGLTNQAISSPMPQAQVPSGLTPKAAADFAIWSQKNATEEAQRQAAEQRTLARDFAKEQYKPQSALDVAKAENQAKAYQSALDWLSPENLASQKQTNTELNQNLSDINSQLSAAHSGPKILDTPAVNKFKREVLGDVPSQNIAANVRNLVATKIGQMKQAGIVSAGQLNSDKDIELQFGAIFDMNAPLETQRKQIAKLQTSIAEADKQIAMKTKKAEALVSGQSQAEAIKQSKPTHQLAGKILTKNGISYKVNPDGTVEQLQ